MVFVNRFKFFVISLLTSRRLHPWHTNQMFDPFWFALSFWSRPVAFAAFEFVALG